MLDPAKPYNQLPLLGPKYDFDQIDILKQVNLSNIALAKLNVMATKLPNPWLLMRPLLVRESVASSGIENINTTVQEVFEAEIFPELRKGPAKEVLSYREAILKGVEIIEKKELLTTNYIIEIHELIERKRPGIRKIPGTKIINSSTKEVIYTPPEGEVLIRNLLGNLEKYIHQNNPDVDPLIKMSVLHYQFEAIHPFHDGNGRVGRILMILFLLLTKRLSYPVLYLSGFIERHRKDYYRLLKHTTESYDFHDFAMFMLKAVQEQAEVTTETIRQIEILIAESEVEMKKRKITNTHDLMMCIFSHPFLTIENVQRELGLSARQTASKYLSILVELGVLKERRLGRNKMFYSPKFLELLS